MLLRKARLTLPAIIVLVMLRLAIGWHFYQEGASKVREGGFSSTGFLSAAKGPFAPYFHSMVPDHDGAIRTDPDAMEAAFGKFVEKLTKEYGFSEEQVKQANEIVKSTKKELDELCRVKNPETKAYDRYNAQVEEFRQGIERLAKLRNDPTRSRVESLRKQRDDVESKWKALGRPILAEIDYEIDEAEKKLNALATDAQAIPDPKKAPRNIDGTPKRRFIDFRFPTEGAVDVREIDKFIPIFDMSVGILLMLGLLTPMAALAAGLFLASVVATQFPGAAGAQPTYYQSIEMVACFVLAATDAGRYAGLDFLPWSFWNSGKPKRAD